MNSRWLDKQSIRPTLLCSSPVGAALAQLSLTTTSVLFWTVHQAHEWPSGAGLRAESPLDTDRTQCLHTQGAVNSP
jgi:hypothetical protein